MFWIPNAPKFPRRASRAGLLEFPMFSLLLDPKYYEKSRRASRAGLLKEILEGILTRLPRHWIRKWGIAQTGSPIEKTLQVMRLMIASPNGSMFC